VQTLHRHELPIASEDDIAVVRSTMRQIAKDRGFDSFSIAGVTTATSELTRNVWMHAGGGKAVIEEVTDGARVGVRAVFEDEGPGIADLDRALAGGYSTARSMGLGLSGTRRLVDEFDIETEPGRGTKVSFVKWTRY